MCNDTFVTNNSTQNNIRTDRLGEENINIYGTKMRIVEFINCMDISVEFYEHGFIRKARYSNFKSGSVKGPYCKSVYGVGYLGEDFYNYKDIRNLRPYRYWRNMIKRCYCKKAQEKCCKSYIGKTVYDKWHNFSNFYKWYEDNYYEIENEKMQLDKDILVKGSKIYGPNTCVFVPGVLNTLFEKISIGIQNRTYPLGVNYVKNDKVFVAKLRLGRGKHEQLGRFKTPEEAFYAYKYAKENHIKNMANKYKYAIPEKLYNAMITYEVKITD